MCVLILKKEGGAVEEEFEQKYNAAPRAHGLLMQTLVAGTGYLPMSQKHLRQYRILALFLTAVDTRW